MGPSPIVKFEVSTVEMLQNTKTADGFSRPQVVCWCGAIPETRLQNMLSNRAEDDAKDFSLLASGFLRLFYLQQVNGERCSGALQHPTWGDVSVQLPVPKAPLSLVYQKPISGAPRGRIRFG